MYFTHLKIKSYPLYFIATLLLLTTTAGRSQSSITFAIDYWDFLYDGTLSGTYGGYAGAGHPDFQNPCCGVVTGLVQSTLGANGLPLFLSSTGSGGSTMIASATTFSQWYQTTPGINVYVPGAMVLTSIAANTYQYSSSDFFPLDGKGFNSSGFQGDLACDSTGPHNFCFTTHIKYTTQFTDSSQTIAITGADDIWVFINGRLVIDLGGVHASTSSSSAASAGNLASIGISYGQTVPVDIFQAQRHTCSSAFTLTVNSANITSALLPTVSITNAGPQVQVTFAGILQQSTDLIHWQDVNPQPSSPWTFTPTNSLFFQARR